MDSAILLVCGLSNAFTKIHILCIQMGVHSCIQTAKCTYCMWYSVFHLPIGYVECGCAVCKIFWTWSRVHEKSLYFLSRFLPVVFKHSKKCANMTKQIIFPVIIKFRFKETQNLILILKSLKKCWYQLKVKEFWWFSSVSNFAKVLYPFVSFLVTSFATFFGKAPNSAFFIPFCNFCDKTYFKYYFLFFSYSWIPKAHETSQKM
jgi:hypothetical protein